MTGATVGEQIMPAADGPLVLGAPNGFEERRRSESPAARGLGGGSGLGAYQGAQAPIFGVLEGLDPSASTAANGVLPAAAAQSQPLPDVLGTPALLAVLLLRVESAGLVRTTVASRRAQQVGTHSAS